MTVPTVVTFSDEVMVDASDALLAVIDSGTSAAWIDIFDASDVKLASITLDDPAGTVSASGVLTLSPDGPDVSADATGTAAYAAIDNDVVSEPCILIPVAEGESAAAGYLVMASTAIVAGEPVEILSAVIGQQ